MKIIACIAALVATTAALPNPMDRVTARQDPCSAGPYAFIHYIGGSTGDYFCESRIASSGEIITALEVWSDDSGINGILFTYSLGDNEMHGHQSGTSQSLTLAPGELITTATLYGDGKGDHLGHIFLQTDKQQKLDVGKSTDKITEYDIVTGGGILLGAVGHIGSEYVENIAWLFLSSKIDSITISSVKFDADPTGTSTNIEPSYLLQSTMGNPTGTNGSISFTVAAAEAVTRSTTWEQSTTATFGGSISVEVEAEPLGVGGKVTSGFTWSVGVTVSQSVTTTDTITLTQTAGPISIKPGYGKACTIFAQKGTGNFPYTSTVNLNLEGGGTVSYQEKGALDSVQYSQVFASCIDDNDPSHWSGTPANPPQGVTVVSK